MRRPILGVAVIATLVVAPTPLALSRELNVIEPPSVTITYPSENDVVSDSVAIHADASPETAGVHFQVSTDGGGTWEPVLTDSDGSDGWTASWDSGPYSGDASLRASATSPSGATADVVDVDVDNSRPVVAVAATNAAFSPNADGRKDLTTLTVTSDEPASLALRIIDAQGNVRRTWRSSRAATALVVEWRGRGGGAPLRDGRYTVRGIAIDRVGLPSAATSPVVVDTRAPVFGSLRIGPRLFTRPGVLRTRYRVVDRADIVAVTLGITGRFGPILHRTIRGRKTGEITFRTRYGNGDPLFPGLYASRLRVADGAGNVRLSRPRRWRVHRPATPGVFDRLEDVGRRIALTFDDCNYTPAWYRILRVLRAHRAKATFFCSGTQVAYRPGAARATLRDGHAVGSHGWDHALLTGRGRSAAEWRIRADARLWWDAGRATTAPFFRPAYGGYDASTVAAAGATGHPRVVMWDVNSRDYATSSASAVSSTVLRDTRPGSIVLLHVLPHTADALPAILRGLAQRGLDPVDLHDLFRARS